MIFKYLKKIKFKDLIGVIKVLFSYFPGLFIKYYHNDIWIISERENEAKDNGYWLYKYIIENNLKPTDTYYVINTSCLDYEVVRKLNGNIIKFGSFKHCMYTWACNNYISSQYSSGMPNRFFYYCWIFGLTDIKFCFLQHGVTQNKSTYLRQPNKATNLVSCVSVRERDFMIKDLGYKEEAVKLIGFCRYDVLEKHHKKNRIFMMFTWRKYLTNLTLKEFEKTLYYKAIMSLLTHDVFKNEFSQFEVTMVMHPGLEKFISLFNVKADNIEIVSNNVYSFQKLINESIFFITDYSSVAFDCAYLEIPVIYYQFDLEEFRIKHLEEGYFDYVKDGFGPVFSNTVGVVEYIQSEKLFCNDLYIKRIENFFYFNDNKNCERTYNQINVGG